jgi:ABC-type glycerol-3-phosphate transport system permease component
MNKKLTSRIAGGVALASAAALALAACSSGGGSSAGGSGGTTTLKLVAAFTFLKGMVAAGDTEPSLGEQTSQQPLTVAINQYIGEYSVDWGHLFAAGLVATVPVIILFAFIERRVVGGLTAGGVK